MVVICARTNVNTKHTHTLSLATGMNAAVRATVRVGLYTGAKVYFVHEVNAASLTVYIECQKIYQIVIDLPERSLKATLSIYNKKANVLFPYVLPGLPGSGGWRR